MSDIVRRTLELAREKGEPVIICYMGCDGITQRRVYVRKLDEERLTAYCTEKRAVRMFRTTGILSAQMAEC